MQLEAQQRRRPSGLDEAARVDFVEYACTRDPRLRDRLVAANVGLAFRAARRFAGRGEEADDLRQVALMALVHAVEHFDPNRGLSFSTFATPTINGSLKRHLRDRTWAVRPPRSAQERYLVVCATIERLTAELRRDPTIAEIAADGGWSEREVREALVVRRCRRALHWRTPDDTVAPEPRSIDRDASTVEDRLVIDGLLASLGARDRTILEMRYLEGLGQAAIGRRIGVSQMHVSRLLSRSIERLRAEMPAGPAETRFSEHSP
jgi:RNA polymerase sigma-B factor